MLCLEIKVITILKFSLGGLLLRSEIEDVYCVMSVGSFLKESWKFEQSLI